MRKKFSQDAIITKGEGSNEERIQRTINEAAIQTFARLLIFAKNLSPEREIGVAVGLGMTVRRLLNRLISLIATSEQAKAYRLQKRIRFYPIQHTLDIGREDSPKLFYDNVPELYLHSLIQQHEVYELALRVEHAPSSYDFYQHTKWDFQKSVMLVLTSISDWEDQHCTLKRHLENLTTEEFKSNGICGAVQSWPFNDKEFLLTSKEERDRLKLPPTLCSPQDLIQMSKGSVATVVLVSVECLHEDCRKFRHKALQSLLRHESDKRIFNMLIMDSKTASKLLTLESA